jgi:aspartyl-tRNA(Asn)/glutamyl-tRNA(Gln) amidotransferase subunit C
MQDQRPISPQSASAVSLDEVRHVAALASLQLTPEEEPRMQRDLNAVLEYIAVLNQLDTTGVPAMAQVGEILDLPAASAGADLRLDTEKPSVDRAAVMRQAPETDGRFFKVPKVIER